MRSSLVEKEVLIREIHHRVKNNLQIISSLLHIQSGKITNNEMVSMFTNCQNRVKSIALIHEKLYQTNSFTRVDFGSYTKNLVYYLFRMFDVKSDKVSLRLNVENVFLPMDTAIPCGLIINELVTNSLKHAFTNDKHGEISIQAVYHSNNKFTLTIKDNGKGIPEEVDFYKSRTVGYNLINSLIRQLGGVLEINREEGTEFKITFSILNN
jgi:two-component sensor histidine kinase